MFPKEKHQNEQNPGKIINIQDHNYSSTYPLITFAYANTHAFKLIFKPDIVMFQNADGNFTGQFNTKATLRSNGDIEWSCPMIFRSSCKNISYM